MPAPTPPAPPKEAAKDKKPAPRGLRRVLRWIRRAGVVVLVVALLAVGAAVAILDTAWGRNLVRGQLENVLRDQFPGGAKIGRIEGSLFNKLTLFDVELDGRDGKPMVKVGALTLDAALRPLASKRVLVHSLVIDGLDVDLHPQPAALVEPPPKTPPGTTPSDPSAWAIELPQVELRDGRIAYTSASGDAIHIDHLEVFASAMVPAPEAGARQAPPITAAAWLRGTWRERGAFDVATTATYDRAQDHVEVPLLAGALAGASVSGVALRADLGATPTGAGVLVVHAPRDLLAAVGVPVDAALPGAAAIDAVIDAAPLVSPNQPGAKFEAGSLVQLVIRATAGASQVRGFFTADVAHRFMRGVLVADAADLAALSHGAVRGHAQVIAAIDARATGASGVLTLTGAVDVAPLTSVMMAFDATPHELVLSAGIAGPDDARAAAFAEITRVGSAFTLTRSKVTARARDIARASGGHAPVHGEAWVEARAHGSLSPAMKLVVEADAGAADVRYATAGAKTVRVHVSATGVPARSDATIHLETTRPHRGAAGVADASFDLRALVVAGEPTRIELTKHAVRTLAGVVFAGGGGRVVISPTRIDVTNLATGVGASKIVASGTFAPATADLSAKLDVTDLGFAQLAPDLAGTGAGTIHIARRGGRWAGGGDLHARSLVAKPGAPAIDADLHVDIAGTHVTAHATASNAAIFAATLDVDVDGPRDITDVAAWPLLPRRALRSVALVIDRLDIDAAITAAGRDPASLPAHGGGVTGTVALTEAGATGELEVRGVQAQSGAVDATVTLAPGAAGEIAARAVVTGDGVGELGLAAHAVLPVHLLVPGEWAALDRRALRGATVTLADQPFDSQLFARFGITAPYHGRASVTLSTTAAAATTTLALAVHEVAGGAIARPIQLAVDATLDGQGLVTAVTAASVDTPLVSIHASAPISLDRALALGVASILDTRITGEVRVEKMQLPAALAILDRHDITAGELGGTISVEGTLARPTAVGTVAATGVIVTPGLGGKALPRLDDLTVTVNWAGASGTLDATAHESAGGLLTLNVAGGLADPKATTFELHATHLDIAPLAAFAPEPYVAAAGILDAAINMKGLDPVSGQLNGLLHLSDGRVPLAPKVGTLRKLEAMIQIDGQALRIVKADGLLGAGDAHLTGTVGLTGSSPATADLTLKLRKVSPIGSFQPVIDGVIGAKLARTDGQWTGDVTVTQATVNIPTTSTGDKLLPMGEPSDMEFVDAPPPPPTSIHLDAPEHPWLVLNVDVAPTEVIADEIRAVVKAKDLTLSYGDELGLDGDIDMDRGDVELFGRRYDVELALLVFDGGTDPELNVSISHAFPEVTTYTDISGRLSEPVLNLHADPQLYSQGQLLGFLLGGDPGGDPSSQARDQAATVGASVASAFLSQKLNKVLPVKLAVRCNPSTSSASAMCTAGKWVSEKLYVGYQQHLSPLPDENTSQLDLEYYLLSHVTINVSGGDRNDGIDVLWRKRW